MQLFVIIFLEKTVSFEENKGYLTSKETHLINHLKSPRKTSHERSIEPTVKNSGGYKRT